MSVPSYEFCTYFDQNYLARGIALAESLRRHCPRFRLWALCMDDRSYQALVELDLPNVRPISLAAFEADDAELLRAKANRSIVEYYFTCTPCLPLFVFAQTPEIELLTYLDADLFFFSNPARVFAEIRMHSIAIIEHRFPSNLKGFEAAGRYNVGWLSFRRDEQGLACLQSWRQQCLEWCHDYPDAGRYGDQKYLDDWPNRYRGVVVLQHKGANVAPWNLANYRVSSHDGGVWVDDQPLIFYHFHGLSELRRHVYDARLAGYGVTPSRVIARHIYGRYIATVQRIARELLASTNKAGLAARPHLTGLGGAGDSEQSSWRRTAAAAVRTVRFWRNMVAGRYMVIWNGCVITTGRWAKSAERDARLASG
jgi:hypothetical protein